MSYPPPAPIAVVCVFEWTSQFCLRIAGQVVRLLGRIGAGNGISEVDGRPDMSRRRGAGALYRDYRITFRIGLELRPPGLGFRYALPPVRGRRWSWRER